MEVAASVATELAVSGLSRVINKLASNFGGDVTPDEMQHLNVFVAYEIEALIKEAKSDDLVKSNPLLEKLQAAALELEDLLDLFEYNQIEKQVRSSSSSSSSNKRIKKFITKSKEKLGPILSKSSLRIGVEKLLKFVEQVEKIHPFIMSRKGTTQPPANTVTPKTSTPSSPFYGRGDRCDMIIKLLLDESHADLNCNTKNVPIIAIRGLGGAGKTTTAQHIYNKNKIENYFDLRMWVHITRGFDERRLITETIESAEKNACPQISSPDVLQTKLKDSVLGKKFLLVLDDVWEEDTTKLDILLSPLNQVGVKGSRIIITTRTEKVAEDLNAKPIILLDELKDEDCWKILKHYAFDDNEEIIEDHQELKYIGDQIISKVKHSPLALKVVGSSLRNKRSANEWDKILQQDILKETMDLLLFSYQCLPLHLQRCFAYCSLFPEGYKFLFDVQSREPHLISLWIAQGFIENTSELTLEEAGKKYIEELLSYSFFEKNFDFKGDYFVIHDLLHELAEKVSNKQCHQIKDYDSLNVPTTCIHLSLYIKNNLVDVDMSHIVAKSDIFKLRNLRSLIIWGHDGSTNFLKSRKDIFQNLTKLRALYVEDQQMEVSSDPHIDKLKHLRYLHVRFNSKLPTSLTKLYQLQFFFIQTSDLEDDSRNLLANTLPQGFSNLFNLRTLKFYGKSDSELDYLHYNSEMVKIEKLTSLQNLKFFHPDGFNGMISLRNLPLGGSLSILNLENVKCKKEAEEAMLNKKKNLKELTFQWSSTSSSIDTCGDVLEGLEPHRNLEELEINGYQGVKFSKWMVKEIWFPCLQTLRLISCTSLEIVPFLPPRLQSLVVRDCDELMQLPVFGNTLRVLDLNGCPKLTSLGNLQCCTSLKDLTILKCPMLIRREEASLVEGVVDGDIANRLPHVYTIEMDDPLLVLEFVQQQAFSSNTALYLTDCAALPNLEMLSSLRTLFISNCPDVEWLPNLPVSLRLLQIWNCPKLKEKYEEGGPPHLDLKGCGALSNLKKLSFLKQLTVSNCPAIESLPNLPLSLLFLTIECCLAIESLPNLPLSLNRLDISDCPAIESLPNLPLSLNQLVISKCPAIESLPNLPLSLRELWIKDCPAIESLPNLPLSLDDLSIWDCPAIESLPNMPLSLHTLRISNCHAIESLPDLPVSLEDLWINECPKLKEKYGEGGPLRNTISHIPDIDIS